MDCSGRGRTTTDGEKGERANAALADGSWLSGKEVSLADIGYAPYLTRLDHLRLQFLGTSARMFPSGTTA